MNPDSRADARRFVVRLGVFAVLLLILVVGTQQLLLAYVLPFTGVAERIIGFKREAARSEVLKTSDETLDVVVLGDSRMLSAFDPGVFDAATAGATRSYNFAMPASTAEVHRHLLAEILAGGLRPDWLIVSLVPEREDAEDRSNYRVIGVVSPVELRAIASQPDGLATLFKWMFPIRSQHGALATALNSQFRNSVIRDRRMELHENLTESLTRKRGVFDMPELPAAARVGMDWPNWIDKELADDPGVRALVNTIIESGIPTLFVRPPIRPAENYPFDPDEVSNWLGGNPGFVFSTTTARPLVVDLEQFADSVHVYPVGAEVFSRELAKEFDTLRRQVDPDEARKTTLP